MAGVGKTQLLRALGEKEFQVGTVTTWGIDVQPLELTHPEDEDVTMTLRCWDFGGQNIYHATHQFFLTSRCLTRRNRVVPASLGQAHA